MKKSNRYKNYFINLIFPAFIFGSITGISTAIIVTLYKFCAKHAIWFSEHAYSYLRLNPRFLPAVILGLLVLSFILALIYKKIPNSRGGGIPTTIGILRGIITFKWLRNLISLFLLSLLSFVIGVPLGNEGPSVQMGAGIGKASIRLTTKKHGAWERYVMTGGACAGFSVATGAPISGIMFAIEEAHQRISPMIIIVASTSVMFSYVTAGLIAPLLHVSPTLFETLNLVTLSVKDIWIPLVVGVGVGLFAVLFLHYYKMLSTFFNKCLKKVPHAIKIFFVFLLTLGCGLWSFSNVSTGHELILSLFTTNKAVYVLLLVLLIRSTLTVCANTNRITGGIFLPILALGALISAIIGKGLVFAFNLSDKYYEIILVLGITACIAGMMKMPLTAIVFAVEALGCYNNIVFVITVAAVSFVLTEIFDAKSINDSVLEKRIEEDRIGKEPKVIDAFVTIKKNSFATGKQIRDIFWPANLFVLSVKHEQTANAEVDEHGGKYLKEGDVLHVRYSTFDEISTRDELIAIVGSQDYDAIEAEIV